MRVVVLIAVAALIAASCGDDLGVAVRQTTVPITTSPSSVKPIPETTAMASVPTTTPNSLAPTTTIAEPLVLVDLGSSSEICLPEGSDLALAADIVLPQASGTNPYLPHFSSIYVEEGAAVTIETLDDQVDLDDDGIDDTIQVFWVETWDGYGEGLRVCGSSRQLNLYYNGPSNGTFGVVPIRLDGPDGIANRPPGPDVRPDDVFLYSPDGDLLPPYAREPASSNRPKPLSTACFTHEAGDRTEDTYLAAERDGDFVHANAVLVGFDVVAMETFPAGDFDNDGLADTVQTFEFHDDQGRRVVGARVCETVSHVADWVEINGNKPIGFEPVSPGDIELSASVAGGAGVYQLEFRVVEGVLSLVDIELTQPD